MVQASAEFSFTFDFDEWATLARVDPSAFEKRRLALIENFLNQFPATEQRRLRGLQFRIDMERQRARTPMAACLRISSMMWDSLVGNHGLKRALLGYPLPDKKTPRVIPAGSHSATILPFRKPQS
jgi:hypothetical protein